MDENEIVEIVCKYFKSQGLSILQSRYTNQHGIDIVAEESSGCKVLVEAKGGTSSMKGSKRSGQPFTPDQIFNRVAKGIFTCLQLRAKHTDYSLYRVMLAVPDSKLFRFYLEPILDELEKNKIEIMFVSKTTV